MVVVAAFTASADAVPAAAITATRAQTSSTSAPGLGADSLHELALASLDFHGTIFA
jgi:hypothetical protein